MSQLKNLCPADTTFFLHAVVSVPKTATHSLSYKVLSWAKNLGGKAVPEMHKLTLK